MRIHDSITAERVIEAAQADDGAGMCVACGADTSGVEPDARYYRCESCGMKGVFGAEELIFYVEGT
jgi:hypothetical protein